MKFSSALFVLLISMLTLSGCKKSVEEQIEGNTVAKKVTVDGKAARQLTSYFPGTKKVAIRSTMIGNKMHGKAQYWYKNGKIKHIQHWKMGMRVGVWLYYNKEGKVVERVDYDAMLRKEKELMKKKGQAVKEPKGKTKDEDFGKMLKKERMKGKKEPKVREPKTR